MTDHRLPTELLSTIFDFAILPEYLVEFDPVAKSAIWRVNLRTMNSISLVCKLWYEIIVPLLYSHIHILNHHQLDALLRTVRDSSLKDLIQSIDISSSVYSLETHPNDENTTGFHEALECVIANCPNISRFLYKPMPSPHNGITRFAWPNRLTHLEILVPTAYIDLEPVLLQNAHTLIHLALWGQRISFRGLYETLPFANILFPRLESLFLSDRSDLPWHFFHAPNLKHLSCNLLCTNGMWHLFESTIAKYKMNLQYFDLVSPRISSVDRQTFGKIINSLEGLQHLVVHDSWFEDLHLITLRKLQRIDIQFAGGRLTPGTRELNYIRKQFSLQEKLLEFQKTMPALQGVRLVRNAPSHFIHSFALRNFPPHGPDDAPYAIDLYGTATLRSSAEELRWFTNRHPPAV